MTQDTDIQEILDNLEEAIERRNSWYTPFEWDWEAITTETKSPIFGRYVFFPKEIADTIPLDNPRMYKAEKAQEWYKDHVSKEDDGVVSTYDFYKAWPTLKGSVFRVLFTNEFISTCIERKLTEGSLQLHTEIKKLNYTLFTSTDMVEKFIKRACPLLSTCIERWKLLNELKEHSREVRVARK